MRALAYFDEATKTGQEGARAPGSAGDSPAVKSISVVNEDFFDASVPSITQNDELVSWLLSAGTTLNLPVLEQIARAPAGEARADATSIDVFRRHLSSAERGSEQASADGVISRECYEDWLSTRASLPVEPEKTFQRALTSTVSGTDGRQPFLPEEEAAVLKQLRVKRVWPAFADTGLAIGIKRFRGYVCSRFDC